MKIFISLCSIFFVSILVGVSASSIFEMFSSIKRFLIKEGFLSLLFFGYPDDFRDKVWEDIYNKRTYYKIRSRNGRIVKEIDKELVENIDESVNSILDKYASFCEKSSKFLWIANIFIVIFFVSKIMNGFEDFSEKTFHLDFNKMNSRMFIVIFIFSLPCSVILSIRSFDIRKAMGIIGLPQSLRLELDVVKEDL